EQMCFNANQAEEFPMGRRAVALTNFSNCSLVTAVVSIQNPSTRTRCTGPESFEAIGISWLPSPFTTAPMENSPPGIQTIPAGALPGGEFLFAIVGSNCAVPQNAEPRVKTATTANHTMDFMNTFGCFTVGVLTLFF